MSDDFSEELCSGTEKLSLTFEDSTIYRFSQFFLLLQKWNRAYNLTAIRDPKKILTHHFLDSLGIVTALEQEFDKRKKNAPRILDVGSGGGFPGIILAIARPGWHITMIDAVAKKMTFVQQAAIELCLDNAKTEIGRVEEYRPAMRYDLITARAFSEIGVLIEKTRTAIHEQGFWAAMKGTRPEQELTRLPPDIRVFRESKLTIPGLAAERHLIMLEKADE